MQPNDSKDTQSNNVSADTSWPLIIAILTAIMVSVIEGQAPPRTDTGQAAAREIIARHHAAAGRPNGQSPHRFAHAISVMESPATKTVTEAWTMAPNRALTRVTMDGGATMEVGYNGTVGWTTSPITGPVLLEGEALKALAAIAEGRTPVEAKFKALAVGPRSVVEGREVVAVHFEPEEGSAGILYFDTKTGLLHAMSQRVNDAPAPEYTTWTVFSDYKRFDGEMMALTTTFKGPGQTLVSRTIHVDHMPIDTAHFTSPPTVNALNKRP
jgi:hypothetical protein